MSQYHHIFWLQTIVILLVATGLVGGCAEEKNTTNEFDTDGSWLENWPTEAAPATIGKQTADLFASQVSNEDTAEPHYKHACAWYGALQVASQIGDEPLSNTLITAFEPYKDAYADMTANPDDHGHVDKNIFGIVPLEIGIQTGNTDVIAEGLRLAQHQLANKDHEDQKRFAVDDMFMITALQLQAYRATGNRQYLDYAAATMVEYLDNLQQPDGCFFHLSSNTVKWGRGNGWFAVGMAEMLQSLPPTHAHWARINQGYLDMMAGLLSYQIQEGEDAGLWKQVLDYEGADNWAETSGTAMFTYAMIVGVKRGWLNDEYGFTVRKAWLALVNKIGFDGRLKRISNWCYWSTRDAYLTQAGRDAERDNAGSLTVAGDNHGQAPLLWSAAALLRP